MGISWFRWRSNHCEGGEEKEERKRRRGKGGEEEEREREEERRRRRREGERGERIAGEKISCWNFQGCS